MKKQQLETAQKIINSIDALNSLRCIIDYPYPQVSGGNRDFNSVRCDAETLVRLKNIIKTFTDDRIKELEKEFEEL